MALQLGFLEEPEANQAETALSPQDQHILDLLLARTLKDE
jgi:hypothetical protein